MSSSTKYIAICLFSAVLAVSTVVYVALVADRPSRVQPKEPQATGQPTGEGPWDRDLVFRLSDDGTTFGAAETFVERAGVPSVIRDASDRLVAAFQWFPEDNQEAFDKVAVMMSEDEGATWTDPRTIVVEGMDGYQRPFDPTLALAEDGRLRLYFTSNRQGEKEIAIYSAISDDGLNYVFEEGSRMDVDGVSNFDSAALLVNDVWHLMTPAENTLGSAYHATSSDGTTFTDAALVGAGENTLNWTGNLLHDGNGLRFYGASRQGLWWSESVDGTTWSSPTYLVVSERGGGDPGVVRTSDGRYIMISVSEKVR